MKIDIHPQTMIQNSWTISILSLSLFVYRFAMEKHHWNHRYIIHKKGHVPYYLSMCFHSYVKIYQRYTSGFCTPRQAKSKPLRLGAGPRAPAPHPKRPRRGGNMPQSLCTRWQTNIAFSPCWHGPFSIAMFNYRRVCIYVCVRPL